MTVLCVDATMDATPAAAAIALGYELGRRYHSGYWRQVHRVVAAGWGRAAGAPHPWVQSLWEDGRITTHSTPFDRRLDASIPLSAMEEAVPVLYVYRCDGCQRPGGVNLPGHSHHGDVVLCEHCQTNVRVAWKGDPEL